MGKTSTEVKNRWKAKNYRTYQLLLRIEDDKKYIDFIDKRRERTGDSLADIIREALDKLMNN